MRWLKRFVGAIAIFVLIILAGVFAAFWGIMCKTFAHGGIDSLVDTSYWPWNKGWMNL